MMRKLSQYLFGMIRNAEGHTAQDFMAAVATADKTSIY